jgi:formylmethanofuran dehydrogenase subunit D
VCFLEKYIDGCAFVMLNEEDVRELVPPIGLTKKIMSLVPKVSY